MFERIIKGKPSVTRTISINLKNIIDNGAAAAAGTSLGGRREIKKKPRSRTRL